MSNFKFFHPQFFFLLFKNIFVLKRKLLKFKKESKLKNNFNFLPLHISAHFCTFTVYVRISPYCAGSDFYNMSGSTCPDLHHCLKSSVTH